MSSVSWIRTFGLLDGLPLVVEQPREPLGRARQHRHEQAALLELRHVGLLPLELRGGDGADTLAAQAWEGGLRAHLVDLVVEALAGRLAPEVQDRVADIPLVLQVLRQVEEIDVAQKVLGVQERLEHAPGAPGRDVLEEYRCCGVVVRLRRRRLRAGGQRRQVRRGLPRFLPQLLGGAAAREWLAGFGVRRLCCRRAARLLGGLGRRVLRLRGQWFGAFCLG
mmetsp:Transcript_57666/g.162593  ORF Transcript_57666/g.162593 Transcript_57666/m.162593 type:complete len:222 (-) Transcript_57666:739-1404(-)